MAKCGLMSIMCLVVVAFVVLSGDAGTLARGSRDREDKIQIDFPYVAYIKTRRVATNGGRLHDYCMGTIIDNRHILAPASCIKK